MVHYHGPGAYVPGRGQDLQNAGISKMSRVHGY